MNIFKRITSISLILALSCGVLAGCNKSINKSPVTVTLWHYYNAGIKEQFDILVEKFNTTVGKEKGIIVDAYSQGGVNELADALFASANEDVGSQKMPDMFSAYSDSAYRLDKMGIVASLNDYFTEKELKLYRDEFVQEGYFSGDGSLKIIPIAKSTELLYVNKNAFDEFSEATGATADKLATWEGIAETAKSYYEWSDGKAMLGLDSMSNYMIIGAKQLGEDILTVENGKASLNLSEDTARRLWDSYSIPYVNGYFDAIGRFRSDDVKSGGLIMFIGSNSSASYFPKMIETGKDTSYKTDAMVLSMPCFDGGDKVTVHQGAGMVVSKTDTNREKACAEFLKWITAPEQNLEFAASTSYMPVQKEAMSYEKTMEALKPENPDTDAFALTFKTLYVDVLPSYKLYASLPFDSSMNVRSILNTSLSDAAKVNRDKVKAGEMTVEDAVGDTAFKQWYDSICTAVKDEIN